MEEPYKTLSVDELEELLSARRSPGKKEMREILHRALTTARQLRETRAAYDREMQERVAAAGAGRRVYLDPVQALSFLSSEQRSRLLTQMEHDRLEAKELLNKKLHERIQRLSGLILTAEALIRAASETEGKDAISALREGSREISRAARELEIGGESRDAPGRQEEVASNVEEVG